MRGSAFTESVVEQAALAWLEALGFTVAHGPEIAPGELAAERDEDEQARAERRNLGKLRKGVRTPERAYYRPILQALDELGGGGRVAEALERVREIMKPVLKDVDYQPLASSPDNPRWRNAAQWARNSMINEGLLKADSPRGVWEITDAGRRALAADETGP